MSNRTRLVFASAMGLVAVLAGYTYLNGRETELRGASALTAVCVAAKDIFGHATIREGDLRHSQVPAAFIQPLAVADCQEAYGRVAAVAVPAGAQISSPALLDRRASGLASLVSSLHRGHTITMDGGMSLGGLLRPGNIVDIYSTVVFAEAPHRDADRAPSADERTEVRLLMEQVPVIAVGLEMLAQDAERGEDATPRGLPEREATASASTNREIRTVTVSVTPAQVAELVLAQQVGRLTLALRASHDTGTTSLEPLDPVKLFKVPLPIRSPSQTFGEFRGPTF